MTTLTLDPLASLLARLFDEADASSPATADFASLSRDEQAQLMRSKTDYTDLYARLKDYPLAVSRETGTLLYMLARSGGARSVVEFGTSFGISTLHLAAALRDTAAAGWSRASSSRRRSCGRSLAAAGLADLVEIREGDALRTLAADLPDSVDLLLLDGAKALYPEVLALVEQRLRPGAFVVADNADFSPDYLAYVRSPENGYLSVPFGDDVELSMRIG